MSGRVVMQTVAETLAIIREVYGAEAAAEAARQFAAMDAANARTVVQPAMDCVRSAPTLLASAPRPGHNHAIMIDLSQVRAMLQNAQAVMSNPTVQRTAVGTGTATTAAMTTVGWSSLFTANAGTVLSGGTAFGTGGALAGGGLILGAGLVGVGIGLGIDHLVGAVRDDGRTLTDLISGANAGVPVADPTGRGGTGWRFVAD